MTRALVAWALLGALLGTLLGASGCVNTPPMPWDERLRAWEVAPLLDASLLDASLLDASLLDASLPDAAPPDANLPDANLPDANIPDAAPPDPLVFRRRYAVELTWVVEGEPLGDPSVDLDLHVLHPTLRYPGAYSFEGDYFDCSYLNTNPDWGAQGPINNPSLDRDELVGLGAEVTTIEELEVDLVRGTGVGYQVAIVTFAMPFELDARALVRVFADGELLTQRTRLMTSPDDVWVVGQLRLTPAGAPEFEWIDELYLIP